MALKKFWVSWYSPAKLGGWELHTPWWVSGYAMGDEEDVPTICAALHARDEAAAHQTIADCYDKETKITDIEWRFVEERPDDWSPFNSRFQRAPWMNWDDAR